MRAALCALALLLPACVDAPFDLAPELDVERGALSDAFPAGDIALVSTLRKGASIIFGYDAAESLGVGDLRLGAGEHFFSYVEMDVDVSQLPEELTDRLGATYEVRSFSSGMCHATLTGFVLAKEVTSFPENVDAYTDPTRMQDAEWLWTYADAQALLLGTLESDCPAVDLGPLAVADGASLEGVFFPEPAEYTESDEGQRLVSLAVDVVRSRPAYHAVGNIEEGYRRVRAEHEGYPLSPDEHFTLDQAMDRSETFFHDPSGRRLLSINYANGEGEFSVNVLEMLFEIEASPGGGDTLLLREETGSHMTEHRLPFYGTVLDRDHDNRFSRIGWEAFSSEDGEAIDLHAGQDWD